MIYVWNWKFKQVKPCLGWSLSMWHVFYISDCETQKISYFKHTDSWHPLSADFQFLQCNSTRGHSIFLCSKPDFSTNVMMVRTVRTLHTETYKKKLCSGGLIQKGGGGKWAYHTKAHEIWKPKKKVYSNTLKDVKEFNSH